MSYLPIPPWISFAYGSAIFKQTSYTDESMSQAMVDLMFVVDDAHAFHTAMLKAHPQHYSWLARRLPAVIVPLQRTAGGVWFNTEVSLPPRFARCKYGVITKADALDDLRTWRTLYLAGRLHKPVRLLQPSCGEWEEAVLQNRRAALAAGLLLSNGSNLWEAIVGLSYRGDVRMGMAEAPGKIENIVSGQREALMEIYRTPLQELQSIGILSSALKWDRSTSAMRHLNALLPLRYQHNLKLQLERTVRWTSLGQTAKGLLTVPPSKALCYALAKIKKRFR